MTTEGIVLGFVIAWMVYPLALTLGVWLLDDEEPRSPFDTECRCARRK